MSEKVKVWVDGKEDTFFLGLRVRHAIGYQAVKAVEQGRARVQDADGNGVDLDGALYDGERLFVVYRKGRPGSVNTTS